MITYANSLVGTPYKYGGTSKKGFDCSGFTQNVYKQINIEIPHNSQAQRLLCTENTPLSELQPGDLIFFGNPNVPNPRAGHAGMIYANNNGEITVIHCVTGGVKIEGKDSSWDRYWINCVIHAISLQDLLAISDQ
jgi:cell wall-associated NlpC family hydrolase